MFIGSKIMQQNDISYPIHLIPDFECHRTAAREPVSSKFSCSQFRPAHRPRRMPKKER